MWNFIGRIAKGFGIESGEKQSSIISISKVRNTFVAAIQGALVENGFCKFHKGMAIRRASRYVDVIEIRFHKTANIPANSPSIHIGRFFSFVPEDALTGPVPITDGLICPTVEYCHFRRTIYKGIVQAQAKAPNVWYIGHELRVLELCAKDAGQVVVSQVLPWFQWLDDTREALNLTQSGADDVEGNNPDMVKRGTWGYNNYFGRYVLGGFLAVELKENRLAFQLLSKVVSDGGVLGKGGRLFRLPDETMLKIREVIIRCESNQALQ